MNRIKELRKRRKHTQVELAQLCNISQGALSGYETGRYEPDNATLMKLADIYGVSIDYLLGRPEPPDEEEERATEPEPQEGAPRTPEARIVSGWMDDLPQDVRKQIQTIVQAAIANSPELLRRKEDADAEHS